MEPKLSNSTDVQSEIVHQPMLEKVRAANCLTESEMHALAASMTEIEVRRDLDALDAQWEKDIGKYVHRNAKSKSLSISSRGEGAVGVVVGLAMAAWGVSMIAPSWGHGGGIALLFFGFIAVLGVCMAIRCMGAWSKVGEYEEERSRYQSARLRLTQQLPAEARLPHRMCPNCLSEGQVVSSY